ncbi:MAG: hypothetical protein IJ209_00800 [Bacteroidaceae bacterium]|nr:hypothetical protein [Bacteroidaceae bacterium]
MKRKMILMAALLCTVMPTALRAQTVNVPFLCIEKTNGEVVKVQITDSSPDMFHGTYYDEEAGKVVPCLMIGKPQGPYITIALKDIKRAYSRFEEYDAVAYLKADGIAQTADVYNVGGVRVGSVGQLSQLPRGVYLVKKGSQTLKIVNK